MLPDSLSNITVADLQQLVADAIPEGKPIEYKRDFYRLDSTDSDHKRKQHEELLKDVSSFANTSGGDLIIGIEAQDGIPTNVCGFDHPNPDGLKLRISELLQHHLEPRVNVAMQTVTLSPEILVLVIRVPQSTLSPHRVVYQRQFGQFWARSDAGAYRMDVSELRRAFTSTKSVQEQMAQYQTARIERIRRGQAPVPLPDLPKLVCQLVPLESLSRTAEYPMQVLESQLANLRMLHFTGGWSPKFTEEGLVACDGLYQEPSSGYVQLSRQGVIESVSAAEVTHTIPHGAQSDLFFTTYYVQELIRGLPNYLKALRELGTPPPAWLYLTLIGMSGVRIRVEHHVGVPFDRDIIALPPIELTDLHGSDLAATLRPTFDRLWNMAGYSRCYDYDGEGQFKFR